ncbi:MAG: glycoside hydrolase family 127 protein, partial [Clostridia bacterium]|nr:glycoside hydrolase family 127 protein [Clostridia bacterium]
AIGLVFFARRMLTLSARAEYADVMERALYNGVISGMQLDSKKFFYVNPLEVLPEASQKDYYKHHVKVERQKWFGCACCPPNIIRLISSLEDYVCSVNGDDVYVHLYVGGAVTLDGFRLDVTTNYPWEGDVAMRVSVNAPVRKALKLRIPGWCRNAALCVYGEAVEVRPVDGYVTLDREWKDGDEIQLALWPARAPPTT